MDNIIEPDSSFDFETLSLAHPVGVQGGAYFTRIEHSKKPLYIQTAKSVTRQGFVKTGKRYYCDLMFDKNAEELVTWFENLEQKCHQLIYEKKDAWFQGNLEQSDIETAFNPVIRLYKSGKYYLLRTNIKTTKDEQPAVKIYNEKHELVALQDITHETELISIVEIQGIKFTSRNFQIELELKQSMVIDPTPIFENCLIKTSKGSKASVAPQISSQENSPLEELFLFQGGAKTPILPNDHVHDDADDKDNAHDKDKVNDKDNTHEKDDANDKDNVNDKDNGEKERTLEEAELEEISDYIDEGLLEEMDGSDNKEKVDIPFEDLSTNIEENIQFELTEVDNSELFSLDKKQEEAMTLKKPNQVYFELYKEARSKAKQAKRNAILAYLEAKNIKKTYMIESINDSDSEFDAEIDDVSESELEDL